MGPSNAAPPRPPSAPPVPPDRRLFLIPRPVENPRVRLFCFPYAGGNATQYVPWARVLPADIELVAVQLPGRGTRFREAPFDRLAPLLYALVSILQPHLQQKYAFFGHSMGALMSFELSRMLRQLGLPMPSQLILSGRKAPHLPEEAPPMHALPDALFWQRLQALNGTPEALLREPELMAMILPTLRADFALIEHWQYIQQAPLNVPITALGGNRDPRVPPESLIEWRHHTTGPFQHALFEGDHFYLNTERDTLLETLINTLR